MRLQFNILRGLRYFSMNIKKVMSAPVLPGSDPSSPNNGSNGEEFQRSSSPTYAIYKTLKDLCHNNSEYFKNDDSEAGQRLHAGFNSLISNIDKVIPVVDHIRKAAPSFDFDEKTPGNGYRSFVSVVDDCIAHGVKVSRQVSSARDSLIFRKLYYTKEVESCGQLLASLETCLQHLCTMLGWAESGELFPSVPHSPKELFAQSESINQYCFYGRCLGFQYHPSLRHILKGIAICMAGFSEAFYSGGSFINSVWAGGKYMIDPELRARRIVNISQFADIHFCKAFWFLAESEIMQKLPTLVSSSVAVNRLISIPPEPLEFQMADGSVITIPVPDAHIGPQTLNVRLISKVKRQGMVGEGGGGLPPSRGLLLHCHGGGFVAQSSRSHEVYLRDWAGGLGVPVLSVDYSLAPRAPYPRALQEVFYAYCWAIKHAHMLGTTGERIVMAGDSAGANLNMGACLKALQSGLPAPAGVMLVYAPLLVNFVPSPARLLCLMDPLLPFGFMMRCLKAYTCPPEEQNGKSSSSNKCKTDSTNSIHTSSDKDFLKLSPLQDTNGVLGVSDNSSFEEISESDLVELQAHKSPTSDHLSDTLSAASLSSEHRTLVTPTNEDRSQKYVSEFLEKYVLESDTDSEGHKIPVLRRKSAEMDVNSSGSGQTQGEATLVADVTTSASLDSSTKQAKGIHTRISEAAGSIVGVVSNRFSNFTSSKKVSHSESKISIQSNLDALIARSPSDEFVFTVPKDPFLSPYWADDELLKKVPPLKILSVHLDPCLDDCVMFAKKMKRLGNPVTLDILEGLPHGFLNFSLMSSEAYNGSLLCIQRIRELLDLEALETPEADKPQEPQQQEKPKEPPNKKTRV